MKVPRRFLIAWLCVVVCLTSCSSDRRPVGLPTPPDTYAAVVSWFADRAADHPEHLPVFIESRGAGTTFGLSLQASVVGSTSSFADVKFIDTRDEAVTKNDGTSSIRDHGVLLAFGPVVSDGGTVTVDCDQLSADGNVMSSTTFQVAKSGAAWTVVSTTPI